MGLKNGLLISHVILIEMGDFILILCLTGLHLNFIIIAFFAIISGTIFPLYMEKFVFRKFKLTRKYILGITTT